jgi:type IV pilus assembly protein PilM
MVNLVLNDHSIRFVELKSVHPPAAQRWGERFLPPGIISDGKIIDYESLLNILDECMDEWKIHKRPIRFVIPDSLVIIRKVSIPSDIKDDEIHGYLYLEIGSSIHLPFEDPVFDIFPLADNGKMKEIMLFAASEKYVMEYSNVFSDLKMNPVAADISPLSTYRLYHQLEQTKENEILLTVQFDLTNINMSIFENTVPYVMRHFPFAFSIEKWDIKPDKNGVNYHYLGEMDEFKRDFEDIFHEISKLMDFYRYSLYNGKKEVSKFLVSGDHPLLKRIVEEIKERYELPISMLQLQDDVYGKNEKLPYKFYLSLGLALKEVR